MVLRLSSIYWNTVARLIRIRYIHKVRARFDYTNKFTLLCDNCMAGEIYSNLGLQFTSPTINLHFQEYDFLKFVKNLQYYLQCDLIFFKDGIHSYPVAKLDDLTIYFDHYKSEAEAMEKWELRKKRIVWENIYVAMNDLELDDNQFKEFLNLSVEGLTRKIMFTTNKYRAKYENVELIRMYKPNSYVRKYAVNRLNGFRDFERFFDYIAWFNGENKYMIK